ncbi:MAG: hypothetical protein ACLSUW_06030 [Akkermansia sp.]
MDNPPALPLVSGRRHYRHVAHGIQPVHIEHWAFSSKLRKSPNPPPRWKWTPR